MPPPRSGSPCPPSACRTSDLGGCGVSCVVGGVWCVVPLCLCCCKWQVGGFRDNPGSHSPVSRSSSPWPLAVAEQPTMGHVVSGVPYAACGGRVNLVWGWPVVKF